MILLSALLYGGCKDVKVGYLFTHNAKYNPDSVVFKAYLDEANDDDAHRRNLRSLGKANLLKEYKARTPSVIRLKESTRIIMARKF